MFSKQTMSTSDLITVQFASAGVVVAGLICVFSSTSLFPLRSSIGEISRRNPVPWSPRGLGGRGARGKSPVFGIMWTLIFFSQFLFASLIFGHAVGENVVADDRALWNQCACTSGAFLMAAMWTPLFAEEKPWTFVLSSILLVSTAIVTTCGAVFSKPFFVHEPYMKFGGIATTFFAGWALVAAGLSVGIVTRVQNHGKNAPERHDAVTSSFFPLVLSVVVAVLAVVFSNPVFPAPLLFTLFFVPNIFRDWKIWGAAIVCAVGVVIGGLLVLSA